VIGDNSQAADSPTASSGAGGKKPNILILWGDDIGYWNLSAYNQGMMGYKTSNIDRIAKEGGLFTDWYGQQSCTAGRSCFITGQSGFRTGLLKVGLPGAKEGLQARDVTIADLIGDVDPIKAARGGHLLSDELTMHFGLLPRAAIAITYGIVVWSFAVETLSAVFNSDHWLRDTSVLLHVAPVPAAQPTVGAAVWLVGLGLLAAALGVVAFSRRDVVGA
jgi:hypothetical protein